MVSNSLPVGPKCADHKPEPVIHSVEWNCKMGQRVNGPWQMIMSIQDDPFVSGTISLISSYSEYVLGAYGVFNWYPSHSVR